MKTTRAVALLLFSCLAYGQEQQAQQQVIQEPVRPTCTPLFSGGACQSQWNQYQQAMAQYNKAVYQQRVQAWAQQQQQAAAQRVAQAAQDAATPLQAQIADLNAKNADLNEQIASLNAASTDRIKNLTDQMAADRVHADTAREKALEIGLVIGAVVTLMLVALGFGIKKLAGSFALVRKSEHITPEA